MLDVLDRGAPITKSASPARIGRHQLFDVGRRCIGCPVVLTDDVRAPLQARLEPHMNARAKAWFVEADYMVHAVRAATSTVLSRLPSSMIST